MSRASTSKSSPSTGLPVLLHVYVPADQSNGGIPGFGVYHTGIEIGNNGVEYCYAGGPEAAPQQSGVQHQSAKQSPDERVWKYKESLLLGNVNKSSTEISSILSSLNKEFLARDYDVVHHNCNHFTTEAVKRISGGQLKYPSHINRAANWGSFFLDNPIKDRQLKEEKARKEEEKKRNPFISTKGHQLIDNTKTNTAAASPLNTTTTATASSAARKNPWANPDFFPGKKSTSNNSTVSQQNNNNNNSKNSKP